MLHNSGNILNKPKIRKIEKEIKRLQIEKRLMFKRYHQKQKEIEAKIREQLGY